MSRSRRDLWTALLALFTALTLLVACAPAGDETDASQRDAAAAAKQSTELLVTPASTHIQFGAPLEVGVELSLAAAPFAAAQVTVGVGTTSYQVLTDGEGKGSVVLPLEASAEPQTITAFYAGAEEAQPAATTSTVTVDPAESALTLAVAPGADGQVASAELSTSTGVLATGTIAVTIDGQPAVSAAMEAGAAEVPIPVGAGDHVVSALFTPDNPAQVTGAEAVTSVTIPKGTSALTVAAHEATIRYGDHAAFDVTVTGGGLPSGADLAGPVSIRSGQTVVAEGVTDATGHATLPFYNTVDPGELTYTAQYAGNASVEGSQAQFTVPTTQTNVDISIGVPGQVKAGDNVPITVSVIGTPQTPTGTVAIAVDGTPLTEGTVDAAGRISASAPSGDAGSRRIEVRYSGDARFQGSSSTTSVTVSAPAPAPTQASSATPTPAPQAPPSTPCKPSAAACVDLSSNQAWLQSGGNITYGPVPITAGMAGYRTRAGTFSVFFKNKDHRSSLFNDAPMPNSVFFDGDIAFHAGSLYDQSHGCIHLSYAASEAFFNALPLGSTVHVWGSTPY